MHVHDHRSTRRTVDRPATARRVLTTTAMVLLVLVASSCNALAVGRNVDGRLGIDSTADQTTPVSIAGSPAFSVLDGGDTHTCGLSGEGALWCWGNNLDRQLGTTTRSVSQLTPLRVGADADWTAVSAGGSHTCGIRAAGHLYCWGSNTSRQVNVRHGLPHRCTGPRRHLEPLDRDQRRRAAHVRPAAVPRWRPPALLGPGLGRSAGPRRDQRQRQRRGAGRHPCGLDRCRRRPAPCGCAVASCSAGAATTTASSAPVTAVDDRLRHRVGSDTGWVEVAAGERHSCGRDDDTSLRCWGRNANGQVGDGSFVDRLVPVVVHGGTGWTALSLGGTHGCGIRDGQAWCWGSNTFGSLGDGTRPTVDSP